jgi:hypothetical protein
MSEAATAGKPRKWLRRSKSAWRALIERQRGSGASIESFCQAEGVSRSTFERWRGIRLSSGQICPPSSLVAKDNGRPAPLQRSECTPFIDVGMIGVEGRSGEPLEIRLDLGGGMVLTIRRG